VESFIDGGGIGENGCDVGIQNYDVGTAHDAFVIPASLQLLEVSALVLGAKLVGVALTFFINAPFRLSCDTCANDANGVIVFGVSLALERN